MEHKVSRVLLIVAISIIICAILYVSNVWITAAIVAMATIDGIRLLWKYGRAWWVKRHSQVAQRERYMLFLVSLMWFFLCTGTALHLWAFSCESMDHDDGSYLFVNAEYLLRSLVCSFQLFTGSIDSNVLDGVSDHQYIKGLISLQAVASFFCTIAVLLSLAYARLKAYYILHRKTTVDNQHNHLYVFFGMNEPSRLLSSSIRVNDNKAILLFVENNNISEDQNGWDGIIGVFTHRRQTFAEAEELGARVTFTESRLCDVDKDKIENGDVLTEINLSKLKWLISDLTKFAKEAQLHIFFLSENEDENIRAVSTLATDSTINNLKTTKVKQRFYCHARRNGLNQIVEDIAFKQGLDVRIVDSSYLAVELLKSDENNHPVRFVEIDDQNPTTVKSSFNSLIIGFDEVGRDALKFLYEFGSFVDSNAKPGWERRSPFHCVVIDKRMKELAGSFVNFAPSVMRQRSYDGSTPLVELKTCDCQNQEFFEKILNTKFCEVLNYIVIAVGDDELGMTIAIRILNHIRRVRADLSRLKIYVRSYKSDKETFMNKIVSHYNEGYNNGFKEDCAFRTDSIIKLFGQSNSIYSYDMIVNEELTQKGRKYQESYARLRGESELWDARRKKAQEKGSLDSLRSLRRKELQDLSNALHADTKIYLLKEAMTKIKVDECDWDGFLRRYFDGDNKPICEGEYDKINYTLLNDDENRIILNLARLEHMRWNASHEMLGYVKARKGLHSCDERTREHNCLRPWQELDDESRATLSSDWPCDYKLFDFCVVDNSILLNKDKLIVNPS